MLKLLKVAVGKGIRMEEGSEEKTDIKIEKRWKKEFELEIAEEWKKEEYR